MYKLDQQASTLAVEYNNRKAFRTMSRAVYEKSVNFVSVNLSRVKDHQESFISREPLGFHTEVQLIKEAQRFPKIFQGKAVTKGQGSGIFPSYWEQEPLLLS